MRKLIIAILVFSFYCGFSQYTPVNIKCVGGSSYDYATCFHALPGGEFIFAGYTNSTDGDVSNNNGSYDCWFVHFDSSLNIINSLTFGESGSERIRDVYVINDTSFVLLMSSGSTDGIFSGGFGQTDAWIRTYYSSTGWMSPAFPFGGSDNDTPVKINSKISGGYLVCGNTHSSDGHLNNNYGVSDIWVLNLTPTFNVAWSKNFGGSSYENAVYVHQIDNGSILVFGNTNSNNHMVHGFKGIKDAWVIKLNSMGDTIWTRTYGGTAYDEIFNVKYIGNNRFMMMGYSFSNNGDFYYAKNNNDKLTNAYGFYHIIDANGNFSEGGSMVLPQNSPIFLDGNYVNPHHIDIFGVLDVDTTGIFSNMDIFLANFDGFNIMSVDTFGGNSADGLHFLAAHPLNTTDYLMVATTMSDDISPTFKGEVDVLLAVLRKDTTSAGIANIQMPLFDIYPNPASSYIQINNMPVEGNWEYHLSDITGKKVKHGLLPTDQKIDISNLNTGMYIIALTDGRRVMAKKIVVAAE